MKVRKLAVALALVGGLGSGVAQALGLGEIELQSYLNEPLDAEITLPQSRGVDPGDVFINIAPESAYERVGLNRNLFLSKLRFKVVTESDGSLSVNVSSTEPLREPYLNFLLELTWPNGRLMREYAVLVDPPVYAESSGVPERVRAPSVSTSSTAQRPSAGTAPRRQVQATQTQSRGYQGGTFGPTGPSDTLWEIASNVRTDNSVSMQQVMLAIQDLNPHAFIDGNINRLKRGEVLRLPSIDQIQSRTRAEATRIVAVQNRAFQSPQRTVDATGQQAGQGIASPATTGGDELKLLVADKDSKEFADSGSAGGDGQRSDGADAGAAIAMEQLESSRRENAELNNRVNDLQNQVQTLQRLLELKNNQLADLQKVVSGTDAEQVSATDDATATESTDLATASEGIAPGSEASPETAVDGSEAAVDVGAEEGVPEQADEQTEVASADQDTGEEVIADSEPGVVEPAEDSVAGAPVVAEESKAVKPVPKPAPEPVVADKGFLANVIHAVINNPIYQLALGGGLVVLLLLLLLLARRNANREKAFYEELNSESDEGSDSFDLNLGDDEEPEQDEDVDDVLAEADAYIAYGRHDQAAQTLEKAISREPSRADLRLKLLGVYAELQDRDSFERQFAEIEALDDADVLATADELRSELEEAESMPSIDDLESQLRSDSFSSYDEADTDTDTEADEDAESTTADFESDPTDSFDLSEDESKGEESDLIEYDLSGISLDSDDETLSEEEALSEEETETGLSESLESELDIEDFSLDLDEDELDEGELEEDPLDSLADDLSDVTLEEDSEKEEHDGITSLDESFLDELDAELDKVANEEAGIIDGESEESILGDLELDVSEEDLALMEEFSDSVEPLAEDESEILSLDDELDLEDALSDVDDVDESLDELPIASEEVPTDAPKRGIADFDESDLGDDDDFDFLAGTDEAATKLDLARAYIEMGDSDGARDILEEVAIEGNEEQKAEALDLLKNMS